MALKREVPALSPEDEEAADKLKRKGNESFKMKNFSEAIGLYTEAIALDSSNQIYFGNRSAAYGCEGDWTNALADARSSVELNPHYTKGFYRLAQALTELGDKAGAQEAIDGGLALEPTSSDLLRLKQRIGGGGEERDARTSGEALTPVKSAEKIDLGRLSLYGDKEGTDESPDEDGLGDDARTLYRMLRSLRSGDMSHSGMGEAGGRPHDFEGVFRKLKDPAQFKRIVMPGLSQSQTESVPSNLQELLRSPMYAARIEEAIPRVAAHALSVLEGVKQRGLRVGDVMDEATEELLKPQILQEALARELVKVVTVVHANARAEAARELGRWASPSSDEASWDQLEDEAVAALIATGKGFAAQDSFLGDGWTTVLLEDSLRYKESGRLGPGGLDHEHGEIAWMEPGEVESQYPALHELVVNLQALPFELNRKAGLGLARPFRGSTMLLRLTKGCRLPIRLDSRASGAETGHAVSAVYFIGHAPLHVSLSGGASRGPWSAGGELILQNVEDFATRITVPSDSRKDEDRHPSPGKLGETGTPNVPHAMAAQGAELEPRADRLVLFRSDHVSRETRVVQEQEQYAILFWMHRARESEDTTNKDEAARENPRAR